MEAKAFRLDKMKPLWEEFLARHALETECKKWTSEFKVLLKRMTQDATELQLSGTPVAKLVPGQLNQALLEKEQPDIVKQYTRMVCEERFDIAKFYEEQPELFKQYQAQRLVLITGAPSIEGMR